MFRVAYTIGRTALRRMPKRSLTTRASSAPPLRRQQQRFVAPDGGRAYRSYHTGYDGVPQVEFLPEEEVILDITAWFVALSLCWSPTHKFDDLDYQNRDDMQDEANRLRDENHEDDHKKSEKK